MADSPTTRSLKLLRERGYLTAIVEKWVQNRGPGGEPAKGGIRIDLYGYIDLLAIRGEVTLGVQTTSGSGVSARIKKILEHENLTPWLDGGTRTLEVHGWRKLVKKVNGRTWVPRVIRIWQGLDGEICQEET